MLKRTLVFSSPVSLTLRNGQIVVVNNDFPDDKHTVPIEDVAMVMIEHQSSTISMPLLNAMADDNVITVVCNSNYMPNVMIQSLDSNQQQCEVLGMQIEMGEVLKKQLWKQVIEAKIKNQSALLSKLGKDGNILKPYYSNVKSGDTDNREGIAARIYWQELFGEDFVRDRNLPGVNAMLNYGYTILRAAVARAIVASGLFPAIGIHHHHRSNAYPLADDLMEPYRPYVDEIVYNIWKNRVIESIDKQAKAELINVLYCDTKFGKVTRPLQVGLSLTTASVVKCLSKETNAIQYPKLQ